MTLAMIHDVNLPIKSDSFLHSFLYFTDFLSCVEFWFEVCSGIEVWFVRYVTGIEVSSLGECLQRAPLFSDGFDC